MVPSPSDLALRALWEERAYFVDAAGTRLVGTPEELLLLGACWAHLQDGTSGEWFVHPLSEAAQLQNPRILELLQPFPPLSQRKDC